MAIIKDTKDTVILENKFVKIEISKKDSEVIDVVKLDANESIADKDKTAYFFEFYKPSNEKTKEYYDCGDKITNMDKPCLCTGLSLDGDIITAKSECGQVRVKVGVFENYFTYEILDDMPETLARIVFANLSLSHAPEFATVAISMTVNGVVPELPRNTCKRPRGVVRYNSGNSKGAKIGEVFAPFSESREILKEMCATIDPEKGIVLRTSGAWTYEYPQNFGNYMIVLHLKPEFVTRADEYKAMGVDQFDFHEGEWAFWQGNFKCTKHESMTEFRREYMDPLREKGISSALHTYAHYIDPHCTDILTDPKWQKELLYEEVYTLATDMDEVTGDFEVEEDIESLSTDHSYFSQSMPYLLIGNEIIAFNKYRGRFQNSRRGACGTTPAPHKKGEKVYHLKGKFRMFSPVPGSELFLQIARNTAKAYNEGGFSMIYVDAIDGLYSLEIDQPYYSALFIHEIIKNCDTEPTFEYAASCGAIWCAMGRSGAWDEPQRGFREFNRLHVRRNLADSASCHLLGMMGWYSFYPQQDGYPEAQFGNYMTKYHHWDDSEYLGALSLIHSHSMVYRNGLPTGRTPALNRNIDIFKKYHDVKRSGYFSREFLDSLKGLDKEYHLKEKGKNKWVFEEKKFAQKRYFDIADETRNSETFENPFKKQTPFVRLEAGMSTLFDGRMLVLPMDETRDAPAEFTYTFANPIDYRGHEALILRVHGNGKKGSALRVSFACKKENGAIKYIVDTDFEGWREYVFVEGDGGERPDLPFDLRDGHFYRVYLNGVSLSAMTGIKVETAGDCEGVRIGSIYAAKAVYEIVKNPRIRIGSSEVRFECELKSTDFIEFDGVNARVLDRYGNEKSVWFEGELKAPKGAFKAELFGTSLNGGVINARLTFIFTGREVK